MEQNKANRTDRRSSRSDIVCICEGSSEFTKESRAGECFDEDAGIKRGETHEDD